MKAVVGAQSGGYRLAEDIDVPQPKAGTMLCRVDAVALNPVDYKITDFSSAPGAVGGCDFAGTVVKLGEEVKRFQVGDRILGLTFGLNDNDRTAGAFAEYVLAIEDLSCHIPNSLSFTEASSMGLAIATAGLALFQAPGLQLREPRVESAKNSSNVFVLVSGGATATGTMATQLLRS
jgi:aspyridone synthetase trans-acting enoyl reductase